MEVKNLDTIKKKIAQLAAFSGEIKKDLDEVKFDPSDMNSIEAALQEMEDAIDKKTAVYDQNIWIHNVAVQLKEEIRKTLLEREIETRIGG